MAIGLAYRVELVGEISAPDGICGNRESDLP